MSNIVRLPFHHLDQLELEDQESAGLITHRHHRQWHISERWLTPREARLLEIPVVSTVTVWTIFEQSRSGGSYDRVIVQSSTPKLPGAFGLLQAHRYMGPALRSHEVMSRKRGAS